MRVDVAVKLIGQFRLSPLKHNCFGVLTTNVTFLFINLPIRLHRRFITNKLVHVRLKISPTNKDIFFCFRNYIWGRASLLLLVKKVPSRDIELRFSCPVFVWGFCVRGRFRDNVITSVFSSFTRQSRTFKARLDPNRVTSELSY